MREPGWAAGKVDQNPRRLLSVREGLLVESVSELDFTWV